MIDLKTQYAGLTLRNPIIVGSSGLTNNAERNKEFEKAVNDITDELERQGIKLVHEHQLNDEQQEFIRRFYLDKLNGSTNPVWLSQGKEIGTTVDDGIFLAVKEKAKYQLCPHSHARQGSGTICQTAKERRQGKHHVSRRCDKILSANDFRGKRQLHLRSLLV